MDRGRLFGCLLLAGLVWGSGTAWSGHVCTSTKVDFNQRVECCGHFLWFCVDHCTRWYPNYSTSYSCCSGWTHAGDQNCIIPVCNPPCENGGTCSSPAQCSCPSTHTGYRCVAALCSHTSPCFPGQCRPQSSICDCARGFRSDSSQSQDNCLQIEDNRNDLTTTQMRVRMSYWPRDQPNETYMIMADSTRMAQDQMDVFWSNRRPFNRVETSCGAIYVPPPVPDPPPYVTGYKFGIVSGIVQVWLNKLASSGPNSGYVSLNKDIPCSEPASSANPVHNVYNCSMVDPNFDRNLEHRDILKFTFKTQAGGFRTLTDTDKNSFYRNQTFSPITEEQSVQFIFDFRDPTHCEESSNCSSGEFMLRVPDKTTKSDIRVEWNGWRDEDSGMYRYAWEVFKMTKATEGELEIHPDRALQPLQPPTAVFQGNLTAQFFSLPGPGMYSVILEAGDRANNSKFTRRLVFFDPHPEITSDPGHGFFVRTASPAAQYRYQNSTLVTVEVTWEQHFRNALHEEEGLLGRVRQYPYELQDKLQADNRKEFRKVIDPNSKQEDHEGERTVDPIPNKRAIVNIKVRYDKDSNGGRAAPLVPNGTWIDLDLNTTYTLPSDFALHEADTLSFWVKATDYLGSEKVERTQVSFDSSAPQILDELKLHTNVAVEGQEFSSTFELLVSDQESGVTYVVWTFRRLSSNALIFTEKVMGSNTTASDCRDIRTCNCLKTGQCFRYNNSFSLTNCLMVTGLDAASLANESIRVTADVTNMAGLVTTVNMTKDNLKTLNGTQEYYPPQNITLVSRTRDSATLRWSFPLSCFSRTALWVEVDGLRLVVHKDAQEHTVGNLRPGTDYGISMVADYAGGIRSQKALFSFRTESDEPLGLGAIIGMAISGLLLLCLIVIVAVFVLWRKGKVFQREGTPVNRQLHRMSRAFDNVRKTLKRGPGDVERGRGQAFDNSAYASDPSGDEIYLYGSMTFDTRPAWQLSDSSIALLDQVVDGTFATVFKASLRHGKGDDTVAAKMLHSNFSAEDVLKMQAKINFMATQLENHENVIMFIGAVIDNLQWGPVLVMEFCEGGQLDKWLVQKRGKMTEQLMENLFRFSLGVAKGMNYLASKQILHQKLAARNILLTQALEPKVAGFGPQPKQTGGKEEKTRVPVKWAAPEVLEEKQATEKSDVWSYGVVLWEIFSLGEVPYPGIRANEMGARLKSGYRMNKPEFADDFYFDLMKECWQFREAKRPTFGTIKAKLAQFYSPGNKQSGDFYYDTNAL